MEEFDDESGEPHNDTGHNEPELEVEVMSDEVMSDVSDEFEPSQLFCTAVLGDQPLQHEPIDDNIMYDPHWDSYPSLFPPTPPPHGKFLFFLFHLFKRRSSYLNFYATVPTKFNLESTYNGLGTNECNGSCSSPNSLQ